VAEKEYKHADITDVIIKGFYTIYNALGYGFLEKVYAKALVLELRKLGLDVMEQAQINVYYLDQIVGEYYADLLVNKCVIVEIKAVQMLADEHMADLARAYVTGGADRRLHDFLRLDFALSPRQIIPSRARLRKIAHRRSRIDRTRCENPALDQLHQTQRASVGSCSSLRFEGRAASRKFSSNACSARFSTRRGGAQHLADATLN
jgi:GxxExxY protein